MKSCFVAKEIVLVTLVFLNTVIAFKVEFADVIISALPSPSRSEMAT